MTAESISKQLGNWHLRLSKAKDAQIRSERRLEVEKGKIARLEAKIKKYSIYKNFYEREGEK